MSTGLIKNFLKKIKPNKRHDKQKTLIKNDEYYSDACTHKDRFIANFTYYDDSNALVINFTEEPRELCEDATKYLLVYYNNTDKIKSIRIDDPPKFIRGIASEKPSFALNPTYDEKRDVFKINFADSVSTTFQETNVEDVEIEIDEEGKLVTILFRNASTKMANMLK
ncbi:hypothetical protein Glove_242g123 [Diversispora epigaea]|uniref:Uncharacterized protein n=1 Tax=Diversispora epigaea TaxID=1348612 RepID=A0A397IHT1_9GLOM|nr:hypothetical protein Glove_242g123 [Diversispora epigaea]